MASPRYIVGIDLGTTGCKAGVFGRDHVFFGSFPSEVRPESVTHEAMALVRRLAANDNIVMGAQAGADSALERLHRGHRFDEVLRAVDLVRGAGLLPIVDFIYGLPDETLDERRATHAAMETVAARGAIVHSHVFMPLPGTPLAKAAPGRIDPETRALLERLSGSGTQTGRWREQERTAQRVAAFREQIEDR